MPLIELPTGKVAEFPDNMSREEINSVLRKQFPPKGNNVKKPAGLLERSANWADENINQPILNNVLRPANDVAAGFNQGMANIIPGLLNLGVSGANALSGSNIPKVPMFDFAPHNALSGAGEVGSFFVGPGGIAKTAGKIPEIAHGAKAIASIPMIASALEKASNVFNKAPLTSKIAGNALLGGAYSPDDQLMGMALGGAAPAAIEGVKRGYNALKPSNLFRGNLTPEELKKNLEITRGTETGLGDVIGSPWLKRANENILSKIPFSGSNEAMQRTAKKVVSRGHEILEDLLGSNSPENFDKTLNDALTSVYKSHQSNKVSLYRETNKIADESRLNLRLDNFSNEAKKYLGALKETKILKYDPDLSSLINRLKNYSRTGRPDLSSLMNILENHSGDGKPDLSSLMNIFKNYSGSGRGIKLEEANLLKGKLRLLANQYEISPNMTDRHAASVFHNLSSSLKGDILSSIKSSGNKELLNAYEKAEKNYEVNFSPFLDKEIYKFVTGHADPDMLLSTFIKTGKSTDRSNLLSKLMDKLPEDKKGLVGYGYLQRALDGNGVLNPLKLNTLLSKDSLGTRQFETLFHNKKMQSALRDYYSLVDKNTKALTLMQNRANGQMGTDMLALASKSIPTFLAKVTGARPLTNALTSENVRNNLVNRMTENPVK